MFVSRIGDVVKLRSGKSVALKTSAESSRPWRPAPDGEMWQFRREQKADLVHGSAWEHYCGDEILPLRLSEIDAVALAAALNRTR